MSGDYKVSIELAAKVSDYVRGVELAAKATDKLRDAQRAAGRSSAELAAELTAAGGAAKATQGLADAQSKLGDSQRGVSSTSRAAARDTKLAADAAGAATTRIVGHEKAVTSLDARIGAATTSIRGMAAAFAHTADPKILEGLKKQQSVLRDLQSTKGLLSPEAGSGPLQGVAKALSGSFLGELGPAIAAGAVVAAPLVGATISGAVVGGAGLGGVIGGLKLAARDPQVKAAGTSLGRDVMGDLERRAKSFVTPALQGINTLRRGYAGLGPELDRIFGSASKFVAPLAAGAVKGVSAITRGVADAVSKSTPVINAVGDAESRIGAAVGQSLTDLSAHAGEGAAAIERITTDTVVLIGATTKVVGALSTVYGWYDTIDKKVKGSTGSGLFENLVGPLIPGGPQAIQWLEDWVSKTGEAKTGADKTADGLAHVGLAAGGVKPKLTSLEVQQTVLNGTMRDGIVAAGGLDRALQILTGGAADADRAEISYQAAIDGVTESIKRNGRSLDVHTAKGRENRTALLGVRDAAIARAKAAYDEAGGADKAGAAEAAAKAKLEEGRGQLIKSYRQYDNNKGRAEAYANAILKIPKQWTTKTTADTAAAMAAIETVCHSLLSLDGKTVTSYVRIAPKGFIGPAASEVTTRATWTPGQLGNLHSSTKGFIGPVGNRHGSTMTAMAGGGVASIYPASNPPLVKFAEPQTGGEGYIPKNGSRTRNLAIMSEIASWPSVNAQIVPMAGGGVSAAAAGLVSLVSVAPRNASRLDNAQAYLQTRDAITSLNDALRKNGHAFSDATAKGRDNQAQVYSAIKAAQDAAKTKYDETGSVRLANEAYDAYIARLRATLVQQKINHATVRGLLSFAQRPIFASSNSAANIAAAKSQLGAYGSLADLQDSLSLNLPTLATRSKEGRDNLGNVLGFFEAAGSAAQDSYAQTGSAKTATALYLSLIADLRAALKANGYSATTIASLVSRFGRISLVPNAQGGVYGPGDTLYQFREPGTGGEAFLPRRGDQQRGERILQIGAGWYGGQYTPKGDAGGGGASYAQHMTVNNYGEPLTVSRVQQVQRAADVQNRVGRKG